MKTTPLLAGTVAGLLTVLAACTQAATPADFGYQNLAINGVLATGQRSLLVILADTANNGVFAHPTGYYDTLAFNLTNRSLNGFMLENSGGLFFFKRANAGLVGPVTLTSLERQQGATNSWIMGGHCIAAAVRAGFDFASLDADLNGTITQDELTILIVQNNEDVDTGAARPADSTGVGLSFLPPGSPVAFHTWACTVSHRVSLATLCHEVSHLLGTKDLYGVWNQECLNSHLSLMSCTVSYPDNPEIYHLDPWHKMQLGWTQPRILSLPAGGIATIPAAQLTGRADKPLLLYDPRRGTSEFFLLEYRTTNRPAGSGFDYDINAADSGLVIWRVRQESNHEPSLSPRMGSGPLPAQNLWRFCNKCKGLHQIASATNPLYGPCPGGGVHVDTNSSTYQVVMSIPSAPGQHGWNWCDKCRGMFFGPGQATSRCPTGGTHNTTPSDYSFVQNDAASPGQHDWRWCKKCQGMFYGPNQADSVCPAGSQHDGSSSGNYAVELEGQNWVIWTESAPAFGRGGNTAWHSGATTPYLGWLDGSQMQTRIRVHPFSLAATSITVEWLSEYETWVDFAYPGGISFPEFGTFLQPFNTLTEGLGTVSHGGSLRIKSGTTPETAYINKRMTIKSYGGPVTLGK